MIRRVLVPPHLVRTYPADASVAIASAGLLAVGLAVADGRGPAGWAVAALAAATCSCLVAGWWRDDRAWTRRGAWLGCGLWAAQAWTLTAAPRTASPEWWVLLVVCAALVNLCAGLWVLLRDTPRAPTRTPLPARWAQRRGRAR